jgi:pectate lyase
LAEIGLLSLFVEGHTSVPQYSIYFMKKLILTSILSFILPALILAEIGSPVGWASVNANGQNGTTGGEGGTVVTVTNMDDLIIYCSMTAPYVIQVQGMITLSPKGRFIAVRSNKTIVGITQGSGISQGGFSIGNDQKNIIFKHLIISDTFVEGDWDGKDQDWDGIQIKGTCHHIWIDHCTFLRQGDGAVDITNGANYITVSNTIFAQNNKVSLIGSSDTDTYTDRYKVTMHHNWFNETTQRHPRVRFGMVHLFNNYYYNMGGYGREMGYTISNGYGIGIGVSAKIYSEHNYFEKVVYPSQFYDNIEKPGYLIDIGSHFVESGAMAEDPSGIQWDPADYYDYTLDDAELVKAIVIANAGANPGTTNVPDLPELKHQFELTNYPNPFSDFTNLVFVLPEDGNARIMLFDITGRKVREISNKYYYAGTHEVLTTREGINPGVYFVTLEFSGRKLTRKIILK